MNADNQLELIEEQMAKDMERRIVDIRARSSIVPGNPGECDYCGNEVARLVDGACAKCRDFYKLG